MTTKTVKDITFKYGENDCQIYWEYKRSPYYFAVLQHKNCEKYGEKPHWLIFIEKRGVLRTLNLCHRDAHTFQSKPEPLFTEDGFNKPLEYWLEKLAEYINAGDFSHVG